MKDQFVSRMPPELPDSPIPAWRHYYICRDTEEIIRKELEAQDPETLMAGLSVGYRFIPSGQPQDDQGKVFSIAYGYLVECEDEVAGDDARASASTEERGGDPSEGEAEGEDSGGVKDEFIDKLYDQVREQILKYAPAGSGEYLVSLEVTSAHFSKPKLNCKGKKCDFCSTHNQKHTFKRKTRKDENGNNICVWECSGAGC